MKMRCTFCEKLLKNNANPEKVCMSCRDKRKLYVRTFIEHMMKYVHTLKDDDVKLISSVKNELDQMFKILQTKEYCDEKELFQEVDKFAEKSKNPKFIPVLENIMMGFNYHLMFPDGHSGHGYSAPMNEYSQNTKEDMK